MKLALACLGVAFAGEGAAVACGCFAPPDPSVPVVQAGERILFARAGGVVTAHIQIQYAGAAADFGWLLPLPSEPTLELGSDELFTQLIATTQPKYRLNRLFDPACSGGFFPDASPGLDAKPPGNGNGPVVVQDSIGPYDYAVLHADAKADMLAWLADNHYFVPAGTESVLAPYIHAGAYFLALKLHSGRSAGDLQPVIVKYASDLPMIPIVLTSVTARPDMGIQVWMLGAARAIPRNYYSTILDDSQIDWLTAGANYNDVVIRATKEAIGRHTFVTEYAGSSSIMVGLLDAPGRFGSREALAAITDPVQFVKYVNDAGYPGGGRVYTSALLGILERALPPPPDYADIPAQFYANVAYTAPPAGWHPSFDPAAVADELWTRIAEPALAAGALLRAQPYLTRLYTTLSPEQMDRDPVFSWSTMVGDVDNVHVGTLTRHCDGSATLVTAQGFVLPYARAPVLPASLYIQQLSEDQPPVIVVDNMARVWAGLPPIAAGEAPGSGCSVGGGAGAGLALVLIALARAGRRSRR